MMCWDNVTKPLEQCMISAHNYNSSIALTHLKRNHKDLPELGSDGVSKVTDSLVNKSKKNQITQYTQNPNVVVGAPQIALNHLYTFFNEANIAIKQANNPSLNNFIEYLLDHGTTLKTADCRFSCINTKNMN
jgi:type III secretion system FlhB-like substrate exporter